MFQTPSSATQCKTSIIRTNRDSTYLSADLPSQTGNMRGRTCCLPHPLIIRAQLGVLHKGPVTFACQCLVLQIKPSQPFPLIKVVHQCKLRSMRLPGLPGLSV